MTLFYNKQRACLNCGFEFGTTNNFCPDCGQKNTKPKIGFGTLVVDFLGDVFTFDSKIFKSLWFLLTKPGVLTKEFNEGKRARFIPPLRMFLVMGVLVFAIISQAKDPSGAFAAGFEEYDEEESEQTHQTEPFSRTPKQTGENDTIVKDKKSYTQFSSAWISRETVDKMNLLLENDSLSIEEVVDSLQVESSLKKVFLTQGAKIARGGPGEMANWTFNNFTMVVFFMVPLFALIMKLLYLRKEHLYIDHLIFSFHQHSLVYLAALPVFLIDVYWLVPLVLFLLLPLYSFFAMRKVYGESTGLTILKQTVSAVSYFILSLFVLVFFLLIGFLLF